MSNSNTIIIVVVLILLAGGVWYYTSTIPTTTVPNDNATSTTVVNINTTNEIQKTVKEFTVIGTSYSFNPTTITVKKGDTVRINFKDEGGFHDLVISGYDVATKRINTGETSTVEFIADKAGTFSYACSVGDHATRGMTGTFVVEP